MLSSWRMRSDHADIEIDLYGNLTIDLVGGRLKPGGPGYYASKILYCLSCGRARVYVHTCMEPSVYEHFSKLLNKHNAAIIASFDESMTFFVHREVDGVRHSKLIRACCSPPPVLPKTSTAIVSPVAGEIDYNTLMSIMRSYRIVSLDVQGLVRDVDEHKRVIVTSRLLHLHLVDKLHSTLVVKASLEEVNPHHVEVLASKGLHVLLTNGAKGAVLVHPYYGILASRPIVIASSSIGAGDMFLTSYTYLLVKGYTPPQALRLAVAATSLALNGSCPSLDQLLGYVEEYATLRKLASIPEALAFLSH